MPPWLSATLATGVIFFAADALWLWVMGPRLYRPQLGALMRDQIALMPAIAFYLVYVAVLVILVVLPALSANNAARAFQHGALLGLAAYATYNLTNASTLNGWPSALTYIDWAWGTFVTGAAAWAAVLVVSALRQSA